MKTFLKAPLVIASLFAACLMGAVLPLQAQEADVLKSVQKQLVLEPVTQGEFRQTRRLAQIKKPLVSNGRFLVVRERGVIWENLAPIAQTTRLTKNEILQTSGGEAGTRLSADKEPVVGIISGILLGVLAGDLDTLTQRFSYVGNVEGGRWQLDFTPKDAGLARLIKTLSLAGGRDVEQVEIHSTAGDVTLIEFRAQTHSRTISPEIRKRFESE